MDEIIKQLCDQIKTEVSTAILQGVDNAKKQSAKDSNKIESEYICRKSAAKLLSISLPTLDKCQREGLIKSYRILGSIRYLKTDVEAALLERSSMKFRGEGKNGK